MEGEGEGESFRVKVEVDWNRDRILELKVEEGDDDDRCLVEKRDDLSWREVTALLFLGMIAIDVALLEKTSGLLKDDRYRTGEVESSLEGCKMEEERPRLLVDGGLNLEARIDNVEDVRKEAML